MRMRCSSIEIAAALCGLVLFSSGCGGGGQSGPCAEVDCGAHGACVAVDGAARCACLEGYQDDSGLCVPVGPCAEVDCGAHGACVEIEGAAACHCDAGYHAEGLVCVADDPDDPCDGVDCGAHGDCRDQDGSPACDCDAGYHAEGLSCVADDPDDPCDGVDCGAHGDCVVLDEAPACYCDEGYHPDGLTCVADDPVDPCQGVSCGDHGQCFDDNGSPACDCDDGYHAEGLVCVADQQQNGQPVILSFSANNAVMSAERSLILTAIVTDPDGIDDLIGGDLHDPDSQGTYGAFSTSAAEGSYEIQLSWQEIQQVRSIDTPLGGADRDFRAIFYDQAGHSVSDTITIHLECAGDPSLAVCAADCADLNDSLDHCGQCHNPVPYEGGICNAGAFDCPAGETLCSDVCADLVDDEDHCGGCDNSCPGWCEESLCRVRVCEPAATGSNCAAVCAALGYDCHPSFDYYKAMYEYDDCTNYAALLDWTDESYCQAEVTDDPFDEANYWPCRCWYTF